MKNKSILLLALFLFISLGSFPVIAQDLNKWEENKAIYGQEERRNFIFEDIDIPITKPHHPSLLANEITTLQPIIPDFQVNENAGPNGAGQVSPSIAVDDSGNFVITWEDSRNGDSDTYAQRYISDGTAIGSNFKINDDEELNANQWVPSISTDGSGNFVITWADERNDFSDIYAQRYLSDGTTLGNNFRVNDDEEGARQSFPSISTDGYGNFVITWMDGRNDYSDIYAQRYSSDGTAEGSNFRVNDDEGSAYQWVPSISADGSGNFVIAWKDHRNGDYSDIYAQQYSSDGTVVGNNFKVNDDEGSAYQWLPSISADVIGNFVITWEDTRNGGYDIYAQRYSSNGTAEGSNFKVNDDEGGTYQWFFPSISTDGNRNFVITWGDVRNGERDVYAQRYLSDGTPLGNNFRVTNTGDGLQSFPDVKLWNNRIYNTWQDNRLDETVWDIWANVLEWENPVAIINDEAAPSVFRLSQNYPNPFNPITTIRYQLSMTGNVQLAIYNTLGQKVRKLVNEQQTPGDYIVQWDSRNNLNKEMPSGIYIYRLTTPNGTLAGKMVLVR